MLFTKVLKDSAVFSKIYRKGLRSAGAGAVVYFMPNRRPFNRFGITAGKKIGGAVERNRAKRILRAAYRKNEIELPIGYDIVAVARGDILKLKSTELDSLFLRLKKEMEKNGEKASYRTR